MTFIKLCPIISSTHLQDICTAMLLNSTRQPQVSSPIRLPEMISLLHVSLPKHTSPCLLALSFIMLMKYLSCVCIGKEEKRGEKVAVQRCSTARYFCLCRESRKVESSDVLVLASLKISRGQVT